MTPLEAGEDFIRVGIAHVNPADDIGTSLIEKYRRALEDADSYMLFVALLLASMGLCAVYVCLKNKRRGLLYERDVVDYSYNEE